MSKLNYAGKGVQGATRGDVEQLALMQSLPPIRGQWFFVDPEKGASGGGAKTLNTATNSIREAYDLCTTSVGDGICFLSYPSTTTADTTAYLGGLLTWAKHGITVYGIAAQTYNGRARISAKDRAVTYAGSTCTWTTLVLTDTAGTFIDDGFVVGDAILVSVSTGTAITTLTTLTAVTQTTLTWDVAVTANTTTVSGTISTHSRPMIDVTGRGNRFINIAFVNGGTVATDDGAVLVSGPHNYFENCYFNGATSATVAAQTTAYSVKVNASEIKFKDCVIGTNATVYEAANAHIVLGVTTTAIGQVEFDHCTVYSCGADITRGSIMVTNAATLGGWILFRDCVFLNFTSNLRPAVGTTMIIGASPTGTGIALHNCGIFGYVAIGASNDGWYADNAAGAATGGLATTL
jgi:hypothetical protein